MSTGHDSSLKSVSKQSNDSVITNTDDVDSNSSAGKNF